MIPALKRKLGPFVKRGMGRLDPGRRSVEGSLTVLLYHEVSDDPSPFLDAPSLNVPPTLFARQMDFVCDQFNVIGPDQLAEGDFERPAALVTFDDGMLGYFSKAVPIMSARQIPSINFLNMETIEGRPSRAALVTYLIQHDANFLNLIDRTHDGPAPDAATIRPDVVRDYISTIDLKSLSETVREFTGAVATTRELEAAQDNPFVFLGNHLANHYSAPTLDRHQFLEQYNANQDMLSRYRNARRMFAYPHGRFTQSHNDCLRTVGAEAVFYSSEGINKADSDPFYNRLSMDSRMTRVEDLVGQIRWVEIRRSLNLDYRGDEE